jgi:hypothetical protein
MFKLIVGVSKKVGRPDYGSQGASLTLETELAGRLEDDRDLLDRTTRELFAAARSAVDEELAAAIAADERESEQVDEDAAAARRHPQRRATPRQVRALELLAERRRADLAHLATYFFRVDDVAQLTRRQASLLIRRLQAEPASVPAEPAA